MTLLTRIAAGHCPWLRILLEGYANVAKKSRRRSLKPQSSQFGIGRPICSRTARLRRRKAWIAASKRVREAALRLVEYAVCLKPLGRGPSRCDWAAGGQRPRDTNGPINGYKMDRVGVMLRADSNAWWCVVCRRSSTKCLMALTPLRTARGVDGGEGGSW
jgi:hypothetical protein